MKKLLLTSTLVCATVAASFGQGSLFFANNFGKTTWRAPIYGPEPSNPSLVIQGNGSAATPTAGTTVYTGPLLAGTGFDIALYMGPTSATSINGMTLLTIETSFSTTAALAGFTTSVSSLSDAAIAPGALANYQVFAWGNLGGTVNDLATAQADWATGLLAYGSSPINTTTAGLGGGSVVGPNTVFSSFNITQQSTPEPATLAIAGLGAAGVLLMRRKK